MTTEVTKIRGNAIRNQLVLRFQNLINVDYLVAMLEVKVMIASAPVTFAKMILKYVF